MSSLVIYPLELCSSLAGNQLSSPVLAATMNVENDDRQNASVQDTKDDITYTEIYGNATAQAMPQEEL